MAGLAGLQDLYGQLDIVPAGSVDEGALQAYQQGSPDDRHGHPGDTSGQTWPGGFGVGSRGQPTYYEGYGSYTEYETEPTPYHSPSGIQDETLSTHGGAWPHPMLTQISTVTEDGLSVVGEQLRLLHGTERGGTNVMLDAPGGHEELTNISVDRYDAPNENYLRKATGHLRGLIGGIGAPSGGSHLGQADVDQGYGQLNSNSEFQGGHSIRIVQHDAMPMDYTALHGDEGTWLGKHPSGTEHRFDGPDSPYGAMGDTSVGMQRAGTATTLGYPTEYASPPSPTVLPKGESVDVWSAW